jgi:hypothetical protein
MTKAVEIYNERTHWSLDLKHWKSVHLQYNNKQKKIKSYKSKKVAVLNTNLLLL